jgi:predicted  nucleic acid-binding Zn-ribbon protein
LGKNMKLLEKLQQIDRGLDAWCSEKEKFLKEIAVLQERLEASNAVVSAKQIEVNDMDEERKALEENLTAESDNIAKSEARLKEIKTQKEYQAVSKEISAAKKIVAELEEQALQKVTQIDELKVEIEALQENLKLLEENTASQAAEIQGKIENLEASISVDMTERELMVTSLNPSLLNRYTKLREKRQGLAVVEAKNGSCLGCNMNLPPQVYNNLFHGEDLISCPHCQRLLFLRQQDNDIK